MSGVVRRGYKQTEVGVIPEDWAELRVGSVCTLVNGRGFKPHEWRKTGLPIIRIQNLNGSDDFNYFDGQYAKKLEVEPGQLLFAWSGSRGTSFGPHVWAGPSGLLNYHTWKVQVDGRAVAPEFFHHALKQLTKFIEDRAHGASALVHTQKWEMEGFTFPAPTTLPEQRAIADALSDVDALLGALDRLIAKKRDLKQAAMQQLLTGQTRLPGFRGEWEVKRLGDCASFRTGPFGSALHKSDYTEDGVPVVNPMHINDGLIEPTRTMTITEEAARNLADFRLKAGELVIGRRGDMGRCAVVLPAQAGWLCGTGCMIVRGDGSDVRFLQRLLSSPPVIAAIEETSVGSTMINLNQGTLAGLKLRFPPLAEQTAIANVLSEMDAELTALSQRREKTQALKQGMMQELLTGRTRLLPAKDAHG